MVPYHRSDRGCYRTRTGVAVGVPDRGHRVPDLWRNNRLAGLQGSHQRFHEAGTHHASAETRSSMDRPGEEISMTDVNIEALEMRAREQRKQLHNSVQELKSNVQA